MGTGIAQLQRRPTGWTDGLRFPAEEIFFSIGSVSTLGRTQFLSPKLKLQGREADHSPPSVAEVRNGGTVPVLPHTS
jgi:hypothetical protein